MKTSSTRKSRLYLLPFILWCFFSFVAAGQCPPAGTRITSNPIINLCPGSNQILIAESLPDYNLYQWQKQRGSNGVFENLIAATSKTYSADQTGAYRVIARNGSCSDTSSIVNLILINLSGGTISGGPSQVICADSYLGALSEMTVPADETGVISYQWQMKETGEPFRDIPSATGAGYNAGYLKTSTTYRRASIDNCGNTAFSNELTFETYPLIKPGSPIEPSEQTISAGSTPQPFNSAILPSGSGNLSFKWQHSLSVNGPWHDVAGATNAGYSPGPLNVTTYFRRITSSDACSYISVSKPVLVNVTDPVILNAGVLYSDNACLFPGNSPYPIGTKVKPAGGVLPYTISWEAKTETGNWQLIPGEHGDKLFPGPITESTSYRKKIEDATGSVVYTDPALLSVISTPLQPGEIFATAAVACLGSFTGEIISVKSASNFGERGSYQWQVKTGIGAWMDIIGARQGYYQPPPLTQKSLYRRVFYDSCGPNSRIAMSNEVEIDTRPPLMPGDITPATQTIIKGRVPKPLISVSSPSGGSGAYTTWWEVSDRAFGPWKKIDGATGMSYQPPASQATAYYRRVVKDNNCLAEKITYIVEVLAVEVVPLIGGNLAGPNCVFFGNTPGVIQSGNIKVSGGLAPYTYSWENRINNENFSVIPGAVKDFYQPPVIAQNTQYRRRVTDALGTSAYSDTFWLNLNMTTLVAGEIAASNAGVCAGSAGETIISIKDASGISDSARYEWERRSEGGLYSAIAASNSKEYNPGPLLQTAFFRRVVIDFCGKEQRRGYSNEVEIKVTSSNLLAGLVNGPFIVCAGTAPGIIRSILDACGCNVEYQWQINDASGWMDIAAANGASYSPASITDNTKYRRKVTDGSGAIAFSNVHEIFVYPPLEAGTIAPGNQTVCVDGVPNKLVLAAGCHYTSGSVTYQWQMAKAANGPWTDIAGARTPEYQPGKVSQNTFFRLEVFSRTCNTAVYTNTVKVMVEATCVGKIAADFKTFDNCFGPPPPVYVNYQLGDCFNAGPFYPIEWQFSLGSPNFWQNTGNRSYSINITPYYFPFDRYIYWRAKITNTKCNTVSYSNVERVEYFNCSPKPFPIVYPNPAVSGGIVMVKTNDSPHEFMLTSIDGKRLNAKVVSSGRGAARIQLPDNLVPGIYLLHINDGKTRTVKKIMVNSK